MTRNIFRTLGANSLSTAPALNSAGLITPCPVGHGFEVPAVPVTHVPMVGFVAFILGAVWG